VDPKACLCAQKLLGWAPWELVEHCKEETQADLDEAWRVAYVAATRARDLLVVSAVGDGEQEDSWLSPLYPALYPHKLEYRTARQAPGCSGWGTRTVLKRPDSFGIAEISVQPGLHTARAGGHEVVWFDPALPGKQVDPPEGVTHESVLKGSAEQQRAGLEAYYQWQQRRAQRNMLGKQPSHSVLQVTTAEAEVDSDGIDIDVIRVSAGRRKVTRAFGKLVHAVLQRASPGATSEQLMALAEVHARRPGHATPDIAGVVQVASSALQHPVLKAACRAERCYREYPVMMRLQDDRLVEGVIDLAFYDGKSWTVVDFKTGAADRSQYKRQVSLYATALARATGQQVRGYVLSI
jgi:ATP-dependent exoDNAse (exonuclease V) beta subunit